MKDRKPDTTEAPPPGEPQEVRDAYDRLGDKSGANRVFADEPWADQ